MGDKFRPQLEWRLPLSGNVSVPVAMPGSYGGQVGLFNINLGGSGDAALEQEMLDRVGSYGRQLGQIYDVVGVMLRGMKAGGRLALDDPDDAAKIKAFEDMLTVIDDTKRSFRNRPKAGRANPE